MKLSIIIPADNAGLSTLEAIEKAYNMGVSEKGFILDKIRDEVCDIDDNIVLNPDSLYERKVYVRLIEVVNIIDKYMAKSEGKE